MPPTHVRQPHEPVTLEADCAKIAESFLESEEETISETTLEYNEWRVLSVTDLEYCETQKLSYYCTFRKVNDLMLNEGEALRIYTFCSDIYVNYNSLHAGKPMHPNGPNPKCWKVEWPREKNNLLLL